MEVEADGEIPEILPNHTFNSANPKISPIYANVNLLKGPQHWDFKNWNPAFGDISRYKLLSLIGAGAYSEVFIGKCEEEIRAIKILKPVNNDRVRREIKILTILKYHPYILELTDVLIDPRNQIISIVTKYVPGTPWKHLINSFTLEDVRIYVFKLLQALDFTHSQGIMHRDVKPSNILCKDPKSDVVLCDWGLAEFYHPLSKYTTRVGTKAYKAPELILNYGFYDYSVDIWSTGVLLLEFLTKRIHVFQADDPDMLIFSIASVTGGMPIVKYTEKYSINIDPIIKDQLQELPGIGISACFPKSRKALHDPLAIDLIEKMLVIDHRMRITAKDALLHPFFDCLRDPAPTSYELV